MFLGLLRSHRDKFEMLGGVRVSETKPIKARRSSVSGDMYCKGDYVNLYLSRLEYLCEGVVLF